jgi:hypothetical protein
VWVKVEGRSFCTKNPHPPNPKRMGTHKRFKVLNFNLEGVHDFICRVGEPLSQNNEMILALQPSQIGSERGLNQKWLGFLRQPKLRLLCLIASMVTVPRSIASTWSLNPYSKLMPKSGSDSDAATSTALNCPSQMTVARYI